MPSPILLTLCVITKNEEKDLPRCLKSVEGVADETVVVDTGSSDDTRAVASALGARLFSFPWRDDFAAARNYALEQARGHWILFLDADEELDPAHRHEIRPLLAAPGIEGYLLLLVNLLDSQGAREARETFLALRLFRNRPQYRYVRRVHEQLVGFPYGTSQVMACSHIPILHYGYLSQVVQAKGKGGRNLLLLEKEVEEGQADNFTFFNLGVEYQRLGRYLEALASYRRAWEGLPPDLSWASRVLKNKISCLIHLQNPQEAYQELERALTLYPDYPDLRYLEGVIHYQRGSYRQAAAALARCLAMPSPAPGKYFCEVDVQGARGEQVLFLSLLAHYLLCSQEVAAAGALLFPQSRPLKEWAEILQRSSRL